jgi:hypothetical protein
VLIVEYLIGLSALLHFSTSVPAIIPNPAQTSAGCRTELIEVLHHVFHFYPAAFQQRITI